MRAISLTKGKIAIVDDADYEWVSQYRWQYKARKKKDGTEVGYVRRATSLLKEGIDKVVYLHRQILGVTDSSIDVDHINGNGLDNRRSNLRIGSRSDNMKNIKPRGKSKYLGVKALRKTRWQAHISINKKCVYLGTFKTPEDAARAYDKAAIATGNPFFRLNFPNQ